MEMDLDFSQEMSGSQTLRVSPRLVAASYILELSSQELQQQIANELNDNPALELVDVPTCPACGSELQGKVCPWCIQRQRSEDTPRDTGEDLAAGMYDDPPPPSSQRLSDEEFDPLTQVASEETLAEKLLSDLGAILDDEDMPIADYLIGSLDDKGYLSTSVEEAAYDLDVSEARVKEVLAQLQSQEPIGIGARNLQNAALPHDRDAVRHAQGFFLIVGHQERRHPGLFEDELDIVTHAQLAANHASDVQHETAEGLDRLDLELAAEA